VNGVVRGIVHRDEGRLAAGDAPPLALARLRCDNGVVRDVVVKHACDRRGQRAHVAVAERDGVAHTHTQRLGEGIVEERLPRRGHC